MTDTYRIAVLPGDGIGPEVTDATVEVLDRLVAVSGGFVLDLVVHPAGADHYRRTGESLPPATLAAVAAADATLLGAMGLPSVRYADGREIAPQLELRDRFELYAGLRPIRSVPGVPSPLRDPRAAELDVLLVRESTEGLFAARNATQRTADGSTASDRMVISRAGTERVCRAAFDQARHRRDNGGAGRVTCVDKANVIGSLAYFRDVFGEVATAFPDIDTDYRYVDAMALDLVRRPWDYDVLVTENIFGDILSDLGAALIGGMGMAPSGDIGDEVAVFQPCHGTAPDIVGSGAANPTAMVLSAAMMLDWLADRHSDDHLRRASATIRCAIDDAFGGGRIRPIEAGGPHGTSAIVAHVLDALEPGLARATNP